MGNMIKFSLDDASLTSAVIMTDEAMQDVVAALAEEKADDATVALKIKFSKCRFPDGYNKLRTGINMEWKVDSTIQTKKSAGNTVPTGQMMLCESESDGWTLVTAPDPQMNFGDYNTQKG